MTLFRVSVSYINDPEKNIFQETKTRKVKKRDMKNKSEKITTTTTTEAKGQIYKVFGDP